MSDLRDPRVLFAAERTLLAWNRTCIALMGFGFLVERFRLFERYVARGTEPATPDSLSFWIGLGFIGVGAVFAATSALQYGRTLKTLHAAEIPPRYWVHQATVLNFLVAAAGAVLLVMLAARA